MDLKNFKNVLKGLNLPLCLPGIQNIAHLCFRLYLLAFAFVFVFDVSFCSYLCQTVINVYCVVIESSIQPLLHFHNNCLSECCQSEDLTSTGICQLGQKLQCFPGLLQTQGKTHFFIILPSPKCSTGPQIQIKLTKRAVVHWKPFFHCNDFNSHQRVLICKVDTPVEIKGVVSLQVMVHHLVYLQICNKYTLARCGCIQ